MSSKNRPTIYTIASELGVAPSTVSRALNPNTSHRVGADTIERVKAKARELGYSANRAAASLRTHRTSTLGLVVPRLTDGVVAVMSEAAEDTARRSGYQVVTTSTSDEPSREKEIVDFLRSRDVDGLILATAMEGDTLLDELAEDGVPFVLMNRSSGTYVSIAADDELGGYLATSHLLGQGHEKIGYIAGPLSTSTSRQRLEGYLRAHDEAGTPTDPSLLVESSFRLEGGMTGANRLLSRVSRPTAILAVTDQVAIGAMAAARDLGLAVPKDLAVVGYNDSELAALLQIPLSSIRLPLADIGRMAAETLLRLLDGEEVSSVSMTPLLMARASSTHSAES